MANFDKPFPGTLRSNTLLEPPTVATYIFPELVTEIWQKTAVWKLVKFYKISELYLELSQVKHRRWSFFVKIVYVYSR